MPPAADILSTLPDPLLGLILSKIPIREAVRCSVLSKRWRFLYTQIPQLTLSPILLLPNINPDSDPDPDPDPLSAARVEKIISNLLLLHSLDIEAFHLFSHITPCSAVQFTRESVWQWVRYAASRNVQHLTLCGDPYVSYDSIPPALFSCTRLTTLGLFNYYLERLPSHFSGFNRLITCSFEGMKFTDESLAHFISHTPFLEHLSIFEDDGLRKPVISAPNLTHLSIDSVLEVLTVNCPKLRTLEMKLGGIRCLRLNGVLFHEVSYIVSKIKMQCGSNVAELWLDFGYEATLQVSVERVLEIMGDFKTLKKVDINDRRGCQNQMVFLVDNMLERLPGLERLRVSNMFYLVLVRDPILPCEISLLGNLRKVKVCIYQFDKGEITILDKLLKSASALEIMEVELPCLSKRQSAVGTTSSVKKEADSFLNKLLYLNGSASTRARICVSFQNFE